MNFSTEEIEKRVFDSYELPNEVLTKVSEPLVSVRTSTYLHAPYIRQCIEGVLMQKTSFPVEYIIGEDFSTDGTREIVFDYARKYPEKIRVVTADYNVGAKANGKRCIRMCRGRYLAICEGDDYWIDPNKLQKQVDFLESHKRYSMCFHNAKVIYENRKKSHLFGRYYKNIFNTTDVIERQWFVPTASIVFRKESLNYPEWINYIFNGDLAMQLNLSLNGDFFYIDETMSVYRRHNLSITNQYKMSSYDVSERVKQVLLYFNYYTNFKYNNIILSTIKKRNEKDIQKLLFLSPLFLKFFNKEYYQYMYTQIKKKWQKFR